MDGCCWAVLGVMGVFYVLAQAEHARYLLTPCWHQAHSELTRFLFCKACHIRELEQIASKLQDNKKLSSYLLSRRLG